MQSSPAADDMEIWATVLADPLADGAQIYSAYMDYDAAEIQQLLQGPQDEHDLHSCLEGASSPTDIKEANITHEAVPLPATTLPQKEGTCAASTVDLLDYIRKGDWRRECGLRAPRKRRMPLSTEQMLLHDHFVNAACLQDMPSASKGPKHGLRRNNEHWTLEEVTRLVDGVEEYGVGRWTQLKEEKFSKSVRTPRTAVHLKDKWRNLVKAYIAMPTPKKKGNARSRFLLPLDTTLIERIQILAAVHPYPKSRRTYE